MPPTNPTTITHGGETYVRLAAVVEDLEAVQQQQLRRMQDHECKYGHECEFRIFRHGAIVVRDAASGLLEEYGKQTEEPDSPTDRDDDKAVWAAEKAREAKELNRERGL